MSTSTHTNALANEKSPYLRQHAHNPVDWLPWGEAAFVKARDEDKPIFLSIGYSTCHWCHVMAHESFEDERVAEILNREFVPIKLDREERPDVDRIYMLFVQATTGSGGWPMSVFLTPDLRPFFGGTYFPPDNRYGRPGFRDLLLHLAQAWKQDRERIITSSADIASQLAQLTATPAQPLQPDHELFAKPFWQFRASFDSIYGGFGSAPKFPRPVALNYLLRLYASDKNEEALEMVTRTLDGMAAGGMHDHLGGGFHRYSVDERWFVPHFEKMMYDQAQLAVSYIEAFQITRDEKYAKVAHGIFEYVLRDMSHSSGAFFSAEDADSPDPDRPGHLGEGAFYIWSQQEIERLLKSAAPAFCEHFGVKQYGNVANDPHGEFTARNILYRPIENFQEETPDIAQSKKILFEVRSKRPRPHLDNKILTSWNGLMISALSLGYRVLDDERYLHAAERAADFLLTQMYDPESGRLLRRFSDGEGGIPAFLDDYAFLAQAMLDLFEATFTPGRLLVAIDLATRGFSRFEDAEQGGFFSTVAGESDLLLRMKDDYDGAEPSGNSIATDVLRRLAHMTGEVEFQRRAERSLNAFAPKLLSQPTIAPQMLVAVGRSLFEPSQVIYRCAALDDEVRTNISAEWQSAFDPTLTVLAITDSAAQQLAAAPFLAGLARHGRLTIYRCKNFACELPEVIDP
ncbi:MAG TPA: thioredoxin domain-containing protein [Bryobacteraceae bacterium]|nr:thioredoxin domain-containing protein [Bryobacteraceae bacterium]